MPAVTKSCMGKSHTKWLIQDRMRELKVTEYKKFIDIVSGSTLKLNF